MSTISQDFFSEAQCQWADNYKSGEDGLSKRHPVPYCTTFNLHTFIPMADARKNIVILGAGSGGISVWNELKLAKLDESKFNVILVNPSAHFPHRISGIRATVTADGNFDENSWFPLGEKFNQGNSKLVIGSVVSISDNEDGSGSVTLDNGEVIPYAYLVLATGSVWESILEFPGDQAGSKAWTATWRAKFEKAESIVLVGGGVVGVGTIIPVSDNNSC